MGAQLTQEEVLKRAYEVHGDVWVYDKFLYKHMLTKSIIGCKLHGYFEQNPAKHIHAKQGCPICGKSKAGITKQYSSASKKLENIVQPEDYKLILLNNGDLVKVDNEDFDKVSDKTWKVGNGGYAMSTKYGAMHRYLTNPPKGMFVDHIDRDRLNNRRNNLRIVTPQQNTFNSEPYGKSKYKGVSWNKNTNKWIVQIVFNGVNVCREMFTDEKEAALFYNKEIVKYHGEFAYINIID